MFERNLAADCLGRTGAAAASHSDEDQLVELAQREPRYFGDLYDRYYSRILNYIYRRTINVAAAEELTSRTFFKALRALPAYDHRGKFAAWLYRIASNEIRLDYRAKRRRRDDQPNWQQDYARVHFAANEPTCPEDVVERARQFAALHDALRRLPERYQTVISLRYFEGMSYDEVADVLQTKLGTVKSLLHRGLKRLRRDLKDGDATCLDGRHCHLQEDREP